MLEGFTGHSWTLTRLSSLLITGEIKGIVHSNMKILSFFTYHLIDSNHVVCTDYKSVTHPDILHREVNFYLIYK